MVYCLALHWFRCRQRYLRAVRINCVIRTQELQYFLDLLFRMTCRPNKLFYSDTKNYVCNGILDEAFGILDQAEAR